MNKKGKRLVSMVMVLVCVLLVGITSAYALQYSGRGNSLAAGQETPWMMPETKTSGTRYCAVNTGEGYPNPGQLIGPSSLKWDVTFGEGDYAVYNKSIGRNTRSSSYLYDDAYVPRSLYYLGLRNTSSTNATWGLTYTCNASN